MTRYTLGALVAASAFCLSYGNNNSFIASVGAGLAGMSVILIVAAIDDSCSLKK